MGGFMKKMYQEYLNKHHTFDRMTMLGIFALVIVFAGAFGFLYEYIFYFFNGGMKQFYWRGGNFLPWINIYATGSIGIYFLTYRFRKHPVQVFLISALFTGILEYISGWGMLEFAGMRCWNYDREIWSFGSLDGFVCLRSVLVVGFLVLFYFSFSTFLSVEINLTSYTFSTFSSLLLMYGMIPCFFYLAKKIPKKTFLIISFTLCGIVMADELYNLLFARIFHLPRASTIYKQLGQHYISFE